MSTSQKKEKWYFESKYLIFYFRKGFDISFEICGYFDNRPRVIIDLFFFSLTLIFPFHNKWTDECVPPKWGISYFGDTLFIYRGGKGNLDGGNKFWAFHAPWSWQWVRTSALKKAGGWENEIKGERKDFYKDKWKDILWTETYDYFYKLQSGEIQERRATLKVEEREWRWHWFQWLKFPRKIRRTINIRFNAEVGERTGSWKGGCTGCSYDLLPNETPYHCLRRMQFERKFN